MKTIVADQDSGGSSKALFGVLVCMALACSQLLLLGTSVVNGQPAKNNKYEVRISNIKSAGLKYRTALKKVDLLLMQRLETEADVTATVTTLDGLRSTLAAGSYASLVSLVFEDAAFARSIEAEANKVGAANLLKMLKLEPEKVLEFTNARKIRTNMERQLAADAKVYQLLGRKLKRVEEKFGSSAGVKNYSQPLLDSSSGHFRISKASYDLTSPYNANFLSTTFSIFEENNRTTKSYMTPFDGGISFAMVWGVSVMLGPMAANKLQDLEEDEAGNSQMSMCVDRANSRLQSCLQDSNNKNGFAKFVKRSGCWTRHGVDMSACLLLPQK
ncbi:MAG: hypothetical protein AB7J13_03245 [Pyrinomonadaceae bacterium]